MDIHVLTADSGGGGKYWILAYNGKKTLTLFGGINKKPQSSVDAAPHKARAKLRGKLLPAKGYMEVIHSVFSDGSPNDGSNYHTLRDALSCVGEEVIADAVTDSLAKHFGEFSRVVTVFGSHDPRKQPKRPPIIDTEKQRETYGESWGAW